MSTVRKVRVLIADSHKFVADACKQLLEPLYEVVDIAIDGHTVLQSALKLKPDVAVLEISLTQLNGGGEREQTSWNAWGSGIRFGGGFGSISPQQNVEATLVVSLYDLKQKELVWRGIAENTLNNNGSKNQNMVEKAIEKMFKQWPKS